MYKVGRTTYGRLVSLGHGFRNVSYSSGGVKAVKKLPKGPEVSLSSGALSIINLNYLRLATPISVRHFSTSEDDDAHTHSHHHHGHKLTKDLYSIIGVSPHATQQQIKDKYYTLSMKYHPDRNKGSPEAHQRFTELTEAYSILGQHNLRRKYDKGLLQGYPRKHHTHHQKKEHHPATTMTKKKKVYDFDEFYRAHYGEALKWQRQQKADKKAEETMKKQSFSLPMHRSLVILVSVLVLVVGFELAQRKRDADR